jgi:Flp pilus assembly secretin CpaC
MRIFSGILCAAFAASLVATTAVAKDPIVVTIDRAKVMRLPAPADTVIIGNPGIADATIHDKMTLILTGKMTGITNLVILDPKGNAIADEIISVSKIQDGLVTVQRGAERFSYNCTPNCNSMIEVGDNQTFFENASGQIHKRTALGQENTSQQ